MCIICHRPANVVVPKYVYQNCFTNNGDGIGFSLFDPAQRQLVISKGWFEFEPFYAEIMKHPEKELLIHFRVASPQMVVNRENCHPFGYDSSTLFDIVVGGTDEGTDEQEVAQFEFAIVHNGRLPWKPSATESDTNLFVSQLLGPHLARDPFFLDSSTGRWFLESIIGAKNKMAIMRLNRQTDEVKTIIVNEKEGTNAHGCWFSNFSFNYPLPRTNATASSLYDQNVWEALASEAYGPNKHNNKSPTFDWRPFTTPDSDGWYWSIREDKWINARTHESRIYLQGRTEPPHYARQMMRRVISSKTSMFADDGTEVIDNEENENATISEETQAELIAVDKERQSENRRIINSMLHNLDRQEKDYLVRGIYRWHAQAFGKNRKVFFRAALPALVSRVRTVMPTLTTDKEVYDFIMVTYAKDIPLETKLAQIVNINPERALPKLEYPVESPSRAIIISDAQGNPIVNPALNSGSPTVITPTATVVTTAPNLGSTHLHAPAAAIPPVPATPLNAPRQPTPSEMADTARHHLDHTQDGLYCSE